MSASDPDSYFELKSSGQLTCQPDKVKEQLKGALKKPNSITKAPCLGFRL